MSKFKTDRTENGYEILALFGPDDANEYSGILFDGEFLHPAEWDFEGTTIARDGEIMSWDLVEENPTRTHHLRIK